MAAADTEVCQSQALGLNAFAGPSGLIPRYQSQSPVGAPQGTQVPQPSEWRHDAQPQVETPNPNARRARLRRIGPKSQFQSPLSGFDYRPQMIHSEDIAPGPLSGGILGDYMRSLSGDFF